MAKAKSKMITIEDALVPAHEQPYEVPENWCWVRIGAISKLISKGTTPRGGKDAYVNDGVGFLRVENINNDGTISHENMVFVTDEVHNGFLKRSILEENDVLVSIAGTLGKTAIVEKEDLPLNTNQAIAFIRFDDDGKINRKYVRYAIENPVIQDLLLSKTKVTSIPNLTLEIIGNCIIPLPPLAEQQRIVEQIESLFSKLDEAKDRIQTTIDNSEDRMNAIFSKAFSGELTSEWRKQREISLDTWQDVISQDVCEPITCGKTPKEFISSEGEIPYLKVYNIVENKIDFVTTPQFIPRETHEGKLKSSRLKPHDVIMNIVGPPLRKVAIIPDDYADWNMNQAIVRFRPIPELMDYKYLYYELLNPETLDDVIAQTRGVVGQANISVTQSRNLRFKCPTVDEQKEVVRILEGLLEREAEILKISINVIDEISALKKAILAKAFRGELGTNNVEEESVELYLKKILS